MENLFKLFSSIHMLIWEPKNVILDTFMQAYLENSEYAIKVLFHMIDNDNKIQEEEVFSIIIEEMLSNSFYDIDTRKHIIEITIAYHRWDLIWPLMPDINSHAQYYILEILEEHLERDFDAIQEGSNISGLIETLPSQHSNIPAKRRQAKLLKDGLMERGIDYELSRRQLLHYKEEYKKKEKKTLKESFSSCVEMYYYVIPNKLSKRVESLAKMQGRIEACSTHPYQILKMAGMRVRKSGRSDLTIDENAITLHEEWEDIINNSEYIGETLVAIDTSSSMIGDSLEMAVSNAMYFSEINQRLYKDVYIESDWVPTVKKFPDGDMKEKVETVEIKQAPMNPTAIMETVVDYSKEVGSSPDRVIIFSDRDFYEDVIDIYGKNLFKGIKESFVREGLKTPSIIYISTRSSNPNPGVAHINGIQVITLGKKTLKTFNTILAASKRTEVDIMMQILSKPSYSNIGKI